MWMLVQLIGQLPTACVLTEDVEQYEVKSRLGMAVQLTVTRS